jgi:hypothetical protein
LVIVEWKVQVRAHAFAMSVLRLFYLLAIHQRAETVRGMEVSGHRGFGHGLSHQVLEVNGAPVNAGQQLTGQVTGFQAATGQPLVNLRGQ